MRDAGSDRAQQFTESKSAHSAPLPCSFLRRLRHNSNLGRTATMTERRVQCTSLLSSWAFDFRDRGMRDHMLHFTVTKTRITAGRCRWGVGGGLELVMKCRDLGGEEQRVFTRSTKKSGEQKAIAYSNGWEIGRQRYHLQKQCSSTPLSTASISCSRSVGRQE